jgi:hypothetical protein
MLRALTWCRGTYGEAIWYASELGKRALEESTHGLDRRTGSTHRTRAGSGSSAVARVLAPAAARRMPSGPRQASPGSTYLLSSTGLRVASSVSTRAA